MAMQELATSFQVRMERKQEGDQIKLTLAKRGFSVPMVIMGPPLIRSLANRGAHPTRRAREIIWRRSVPRSIRPSRPADLTLRRPFPALTESRF